MDWNSLEEIVLHTLEGFIIASLIIAVIGGLLVLLILNMLGKANKSAQKYWLYYKEGNKKMLDRMKTNPYYKDRIQHRLKRSEFQIVVTIVMMVLSMTTTLIVKVQNGVDTPTIILKVMMVVLFLSFTLLLIIYWQLDSVFTEYLDFKSKEYEADYQET